jgi:hypothetical protein
MCIGFFSVSCSWRPVCILSLTSCVIPTAAYPMVGHCLLCLTSSHKVGCSQSPILCLMHAKVWSNGLLLFHTLTMWLWMAWTELKGATPDILQRLIPEHARKQNPTLALWGQPASQQAYQWLQSHPPFSLSQHSQDWFILGKGLVTCSFSTCSIHLLSCLFLHSHVWLIF